MINIKLLPYFYQKKYFNFFNQLSEFENKILKTNKIKIIKPIFICGFARSGTTIIAHLLSKSYELGYFKYRDLPFLKIPYFWSFFNKFYYLNKKIARPHGDNLIVETDSPDSFEEYFWSNTINNYDYNFSKFLNSVSNDYIKKNIEYELFNNIKKILSLRKKKRYLSKNNYNIFRLNLLIEKFNDCKILLCIRNPINTSISLEKVNNLFNKISIKNKFFKEEMNYLCHFEFGPTKKTITANNHTENENYWSKKSIYEGYLNQWIYVYEKLLNNLKKNFPKNVKIIIHENFIEKQKYVISDMFDFLEIKQDDNHEEFLKKIIKKNSQVNNKIFNEIEEKSLNIFNEYKYLAQKN